MNAPLQTDAAETYGRLKEGVHVAGYSFERACAHLEWLLDENRWRLGGRFDNVNEFLDSVKLDQFRIVTDQRKRIAQRIKDLQPKASNTAIAKVVGATPMTVGRDLREVTNVSSANAVATNGDDKGRSPVTNVISEASGIAAAKLVAAQTAKAEKSEQKRAVALDRPEGRCRVDDLQSLVAGQKRFGTIYADPPWLYDNQGTRAATGNHYGGMTVDEICALPITKIAADDAHLHLWTTNAFLFDCPKIFAAWGFEFRSSFVWVKPQMGIGNYWRNSHEILLTAIRGDAKRFEDKNLMSWIECDRSKHSAKPEQVRSFIERASPGPYLELFGRREADGWAVWGDQIESSIFDAAVREVA